MRILVVGDIHGMWRYINTLINKKSPDIILQCGDFGWWPKFHNTRMISSGEYERITHDYGRREKKWNQYGIKNKNTKIYWCDGNHEDHWDIKDNKPGEIMPGVFYMKRGSTLKLPTGENVLFMGGADSIDKKWRTIGIDWFPEELINHSQLYDLPDEKVDIVISHTCPEEFLYGLKLIIKDKTQDPCTKALSYILKKYRPKKWFFGHFHQFKQGKDEGVEWTCLNMAPEGGWWVEL